MTSKELLEQAEALTLKAAEARKNEMAGAITNIRAIMMEHGVTKEDLFPAVAKKARNVVSGVAKYRDPKSGATWTGKGRNPAWVSALKASGGDLAACAIQ